VATWRRKLLTRTFWIPPLELIPPGGPVGEHEVLYNSSTGKWQIASPDPVNINPPTALTQLTDVFLRDWPEGAMERLLHTANTVVFEQGRLEVRQDPRGDAVHSDIDDLANNFTLFGRAVEEVAPEA
jgi:hypothetical protein